MLASDWSETCIYTSWLTVATYLASAHGDLNTSMEKKENISKVWEK
jgi:hypothetical protein